MKEPLNPIQPTNQPMYSCQSGIFGRVAWESLEIFKVFNVNFRKQILGVSIT